MWTSLRDPQSAPAGELIELYARRWEHELYYRELKRQLRKNEVLPSHTLETGAQEIAALVLAGALLARERARAAAGQTPVLRISFVKTLELMRPLWLAEIGNAWTPSPPMTRIPDSWQDWPVPERSPPPPGPRR